MKKYYLLKTLFHYYLFSLSDSEKNRFDQKTAYKLLLVTDGRRWPFMTPGNYYYLDHILYDNNYNNNENRIEEFNSDEDAILWFKLTYKV